MVKALNGVNIHIGVGETLGPGRRDRAGKDHAGKRNHEADPQSSGQDSGRR